MYKFKYSTLVQVREEGKISGKPVKCKDDVQTHLRLSSTGAARLWCCLLSCYCIARNSAEVSASSVVILNVSHIPVCFCWHAPLLLTPCCCCHPPLLLLPSILLLASLRMLAFLLEVYTYYCKHLLTLISWFMLAPLCFWRYWPLLSSDKKLYVGYNSKN